VEVYFEISFLNVNMSLFFFRSNLDSFKYIIFNISHLLLAMTLFAYWYLI